ncbi:imidazole glycerol phosphate synthase subunit HisF [Ornithinimicrobium murale]|uniref:imidazole glycerol phosphate synthase subunit HisF n=1 Tax=Ornithinimicrobium murale TaxID=1050153 RepID=UPI000E0CE1BC|nr:imidazole glycerol phosphate synthase subunit HisF [Ornithinimicrobium murale]
MTLARRVIACLDVSDGRVVKGTRFRDHQDMGGITELAARYSAEGVDELVFYDITASPQGRRVDLDWIDRVAREIDIPFCVAGGISSVEDARAVLLAGADKVSVNTPATRRPELVGELAREFGTQCVVVGVDSLRDEDGQWRIRQLTGDPDATRALETTTLAWVERVQELGAGEVVLNAMGSDGVRRGYDVEQLRAVRQVCQVPLIASGGAGSAQHFIDVFRDADVDGALAAGVFHSGELAIRDLKERLGEAGIEVRMDDPVPVGGPRTPPTTPPRIPRSSPTAGTPTSMEGTTA